MSDIPDSPQEHAAKGLWLRFGDKLWDLLPWAVPALAGAIVTGGLAIRDAGHGMDELRLDVTDLQQHRQGLVDCVKRAEFDALRGASNALGARLGVLETNVFAHESSAAEWKKRIAAAEADLKRLVETQANGRVQPQELRELEIRIRALEKDSAVGERRLDGLEKGMQARGNR